MPKRNVTSECSVGLRTLDEGGYYVALYHKDVWILEFGLKQVNTNPDAVRLGYEIEHTYPDLTLGWFKILK